MEQKKISKQADKNVAAALRCAKVLMPKGSPCDWTSLANRILRLGAKYRMLDHI